VTIGLTLVPQYSYTVNLQAESGYYLFSSLLPRDLTIRVETSLTLPIFVTSTSYAVLPLSLLPSLSHVVLSVFELSICVHSSGLLLDVKSLCASVLNTVL
jgi:hypothetical protein